MKKKLISWYLRNFAKEQCIYYATSVGLLEIVPDLSCVTDSVKWRSVGRGKIWLDRASNRGRMVISVADPGLDVLCAHIMEWSYKTFPNATAESHLEKANAELLEVKAALELNSKEWLIEEYADVFICLLGSMRKKGFDADMFIEAVRKKHGVNEKRNWKLNSNNTYSHT